ncbi:11488_t:CDS:2 [Paraglomus brasilianum]|uniref:11488_t:CDS:1 n=1 Tax=Paraglomus brasilianum TaxID=144538 RepID=A0A9N9GV35_9GLOM|nr:11488_t:CDS:2 [Paraglomus brasilianum]
MSVSKGTDSTKLTEKEKALAGLAYNANTPELIADRRRARVLTYKFNNSDPSRDNYISERQTIIRELFGSIGKDFDIEPPFYCDYGYNIHIGDDFFANFGLTILDCNKVEIGDRVLFAPNVSLYGPTHSVNPADRVSEDFELAYPIKIGNDVWIGGGVIILPGITIGDGATVGAGSVVTKNVEPYTVVAGNPAKFLRYAEKPNQIDQIKN